MPLPLSVNVAPVGSDDVDDVRSVLSGSIAEITKFKFSPSVVLRAPIVASIGSDLLSGHRISLRAELIT